MACICEFPARQLEEVAAALPRDSTILTVRQPPAAGCSGGEGAVLVVRAVSPKVTFEVKLRRVPQHAEPTGNTQDATCDTARWTPFWPQIDAAEPHCDVRRQQAVARARAVVMCLFQFSSN
jgi:hypothetical protein